MGEKTIIVRDRRQVHQFSTHNRVIDEWVPIIGPVGFAIYSLYVRMANKRDERSWSGYTTTSQHLGIGRTSVSRYNRLLMWCGLIHIEPGDRNKPNDYYILPIPRMTPERMEHIRVQAATLPEQDPFRRTVIGRLDEWAPIQALWGRKSDKPATCPQVVDKSAGPSPVVEQGSPVVEQGSPVVEQGSPVVEQGSPVVEQGSPVVEQGVPHGDCNNPNQQSKPTIHRNNPQQQHGDNGGGNGSSGGGGAALLERYGVLEPIRSRLGESVPCEVIRAWGLYVDTHKLRSPAGFLVSKLREGCSPGWDYTRLAKIGEPQWGWLTRNAPGRDLVGMWPAGLPVDAELADLWYDRYYLKRERGPM